MNDRRDLKLAGLLLVLMGGLAFVGLEAQPGPRGPRALAPNPDVRSVVVEQAPGDSVDVNVTWGAAIVRPSGAVADLHVLDVMDADTVRFLVTDSLAPPASGTTMSSTVRVPADTVDIAAEACVQAHHSGLSSQRRCSNFTIPSRMLLEDPTAPSVEVEVDSVAILPDSATIAVGDSVQFTAWVYSGNAVIGCSGNCLQAATVPMEPVRLTSTGEAFYLLWSDACRGERPTCIESYDRAIYDVRQPLLAALWRHRLQGRV